MLAERHFRISLNRFGTAARPLRLIQCSPLPLAHSFRHSISTAMAYALFFRFAGALSFFAFGADGASRREEEDCSAYHCQMGATCFS